MSEHETTARPAVQATIPANDVVDAEQARFNRFIRAENERLNRLIRNLYLHFQLEHYSERALYDHICQEVAAYFRADCCALYLVRYREEEPDPATSGLSQRGQRRLLKWLELVGAVGPWRRALRQRYVRQRSGNRYQLPGECPLEEFDRELPTGMTSQGFISDEPTRYTSGYDWRERSADSLGLRREAPRQVVWYQDNLFNSCRCSMMAPLVREGKSTSGLNGTPRYRKVGLLKVENRAPYGMPAYSDFPSGRSGREDLWFPFEWSVAALRPYIRDLRENKDPFAPLNNNIGWQQYFDDHPTGAGYFQELLLELGRRQRMPDAAAEGKSLRQRYTELAEWLEHLVECLIRIEGWLHHLGHACLLLCGVGEAPSLDRPTPALFNTYNLRAAYREHWFESECPSSSSPPTDSRSGTDHRPSSAYHGVRDALFQCLTRNCSGPQPRDLTDLDDALLFLDHLDTTLESYRAERIAIEDLRTTLSPLESEISRRVTELADRSLHRHRQRLQELIPSVERLVEAIRGGSVVELAPAVPGAHRALGFIRSIVTQEVKDHVQRYIDQHAHKIRATLGSSTERFDIVRCLEGECPGWDFQIALQTVLDDLTQITDALRRLPHGDHEVSHLLTSEQAEVRHIVKMVCSILENNLPMQEDHGVNCTLKTLARDAEHPPADQIGCKVARALAAATMHADSFHQIDERRLIFIASHVTQVLDNHLLHQARQRELELTYAGVDVLALEPLGLELLDAMQAGCGRVASALGYLIERGAYHANREVSVAPAYVSTTGRFVQRLTGLLESRPRNRERFELPLVTLSLSGLERPAMAVLEQIVATAERLQVLIKSNAATIRFLPSQGMVGARSHPLSEVVLRLTTPASSAPGAPRSMELVLRLDGDAVRVRDRRALWCGVRVLEEVVRVIEGSTGASVHGPHTDRNIGRR